MIGPQTDMHNEKDEWIFRTHRSPPLVSMTSRTKNTTSNAAAVLVSPRKSISKCSTLPAAKGRRKHDEWHQVEACMSGVTTGFRAGHPATGAVGHRDVVPMRCWGCVVLLPCR